MRVRRRPHASRPLTDALVDPATTACMRYKNSSGQLVATSVALDAIVMRYGIVRIEPFGLPLASVATTFSYGW